MESHEEGDLNKNKQQRNEEIGELWGRGPGWKKCKRKRNEEEIEAG